MGETLTVQEHGEELCAEHGHEIPTGLEFGYSWLGGNYRAICTGCGMVFLLWECVCELVCRRCEQ